MLNALTVTLVLFFALSRVPLVHIERALRSGPDVRVVTHGDTNGIALDARNRYLFVSGHGVPHLLRFDTANPSVPPAVSDVPTHGAQSLALDLLAGTAFFVSPGYNVLTSIDMETLRLVRSYSLDPVSPGDVLIAVHNPTDTIIVASETDIRTGIPFFIIDRASGKIRYRRSEEIDNLVLHPTKPILYMTFALRAGGVMAYDFVANEITAHNPADERLDHLDFDPKANEVLVASPVEGSVFRYDGDTLRKKGAIRAMFGARTLAVDRRRNVLLVSSIATGTVAMIDLVDHQVKKSWYVGPWLRSIVLAEDRGVAYISSNGALYELTYAR